MHLQNHIVKEELTRHFNIKLCFTFWQLGPNVKELFRLVEDFVDVISLRMKDFQDTYEVTDNLG